MTLLPVREGVPAQQPVVEPGMTAKLSSDPRRTTVTSSAVERPTIGALL
jgi:hypothetical protein